MEDLDRLLREITKDNGILKRHLARLRLESIEAWNRGDQRSLFRLSFLENQVNRVMGRDATQKV